MMKKRLLLFLLFLSSTTGAYAQDERDKDRIFWLYEVGNQMALSDFEMGSTETIKDKDGNGFGMSFVIKEGKQINLAFDVGTSSTKYQGTIEDGVSVTFVPQDGSGFEALSSSTNVTYDFDLAFSNPYAGFSIAMEHFRFGGGRLFQKAEGDVTISSQDVTLVTAEYVATTQLYYWAGFDFSLDFLYIGIYARSFEAPELQIKSCNEAALGELLCARLEGATGNRNQRPTSFGEGMLHIGFMF